MSEVHLRVRAGGEHYALPVAGVLEIARFGQITPVPGAPAAVLGVWNLRGDVMAVLDLATVLGLGGAEADRIVVVEAGELRGGLAVEAVLGVDPIPDSVEPAESEYISRAVLVDRNPVGVIDLAAVLGSVNESVAR